MRKSTPTILLLAGTDTYCETGFSKTAQAAIDASDFLVTLEPNAKNSLPRKWQQKTTVIPQSAHPARKLAPLKSCFEISVCGHLRPVKLPFTTASACLKLPDGSQARVNHYGIALTDSMKKSAVDWMSKSPRYHWLGGKPHWRTRQLIGRSRLHINSSRIESCANSIIESIVAGTPVLASRIPGNTGVLGEDYPGLFKPGHSNDLTVLIQQAESDKKFLARIKSRCAILARNHRPKTEQENWESLLNQIA